MMNATIKFHIFFLFGLLLFGPAQTAHSRSWGQLRIANIAVTILADRKSDSAIRGQIPPGQWVKVDFMGNNWVAVFPKEATKRDEAFAQADLDTGLIPRRHDALFPSNQDVPASVLAFAACAVLTHQGMSGQAPNSDPWAVHDAWRVNSGSSFKVIWI